jgi:hypothetical protein
MWLLRYTFKYLYCGIYPITWRWNPSWKFPEEEFKKSNRHLHRSPFWQHNSWAVYWTVLTSRAQPVVGTQPKLSEWNKPATEKSSTQRPRGNTWMWLRHKLLTCTTKSKPWICHQLHGLRPTTWFLSLFFVVVIVYSARQGSYRN